MPVKDKKTRIRLIVFGLLGPTAALSAELCPTIVEAPPTPQSLVEQDPGKLPEIKITADKASLSDEGGEFEGAVQVRQGDQTITATRARYDAQAGTFEVTGNVEFSDPNIRVSSEEAGFDATHRSAEFEGASFELLRRPARGAAERIELSADRRLTLDVASFSSCPEDKEDWRLRAKQIHMDHAKGVAIGRGVRLDFKGVPILYTPYISFPIGEQRKSGFLIPELAHTQSSGTDLGAPYYWNIASNYDATVSPRWLSRRGFMLTTQFRYLLPDAEGQLDVNLLPDDRVNNDSRSFLKLFHQNRIGEDWRFTADLQHVSDGTYFEDLANSLSATSQTHLDRRLDLEYTNDSMSVLVRAQAYQTIDTTIQSFDQPYQRLPQLYMHGYWPDRWLGLTYQLDAELVNFDRNSGVTGTRFDFMPELRAPFERPGYFVVPALALEHTRYRLSHETPGQDTQPTRTAPIASLDMGALFERVAGKQNRLLHTLEPRMLYVHVPFRDQQALPVFDTIAPDFNLVQLYRKNRFLGPDRLGDTDQVSVGLTTRLLDLETGEEYFNATIGQTRSFSNQQVTLPDDQPPGENNSDYIVEVGFQAYRDWNIDLGYQWNSETDSTRKAEMRFQYSPANNRILNVAYRFRRGALEQGDLSFAWPASERWSLVGRYNYSFLEETALERFLGVEYEACCFGVRLVARRYISRRTGESDTSIAIQVELKGLTSVGDRADKLLERGILGYRRETI